MAHAQLHVDGLRSRKLKTAALWSAAVAALIAASSSRSGASVLPPCLLVRESRPIFGTCTESNSGVSRRVSNRAAFRSNVLAGSRRLPPRTQVTTEVFPSRALIDSTEEGVEETDAFIVNASAVRSRLDNLLAERYIQSRSYFAALIDRGAVLVNGRQQKKSFRKLSEGDTVEVRFLMDEKNLPLEPENIPLDILHEDEDLLVVNKLPGMVVHPAPGNWNGTLVHAVLHHVRGSIDGDLPEAPPVPGGLRRPGIVHRLDVGTSGVIVVAKTLLAYDILRRAFEQREISKTYLAVVVGTRNAFRGFGAGHGYHIDHAIGRSRINRLKMEVQNNGKPSSSFARIVAETREQHLSLVEVLPRTGRTHQIRVHLSTENVPILGDTVYGSHHISGKKATRPLLHARRIAFTHPRSGEPVSFQAPLPKDMQAFVKQMAADSPADKDLLAELCDAEVSHEGSSASPAIVHSVVDEDVLA